MSKYNSAHRGRVIETATSASGDMYRIYDDGSCCTFHIFTIEQLKIYGKTRVWKPTNGKMYTDYRDARNVLKQIAA